MQHPRLSLRPRFAVTFAGLVVLSSIILSLFIGARSSRMAEAQIGTNLADLSFQMADKLDWTMWTRKQEMLVLSSLEAIASRRA